MSRRRAPRGVDWALSRLRCELLRLPVGLRETELRGLTQRARHALLAFMEAKQLRKALGEGPPLRVSQLLCAGRRLYRAQGFVLSLRMRTCAVPEPLARSFQRVLQKAQQACRRRVQLGELLDGELLEEVFHMACREQGVAMRSMGLAFRAEA